MRRGVTVAEYEFRVRGSVSETVLESFPDLTRAPCPAGATVLSGRVEDDSDVLTILARFGDFGLSVVEMRQLPD